MRNGGGLLQPAATRVLLRRLKMLGFNIHAFDDAGVSGRVDAEHFAGFTFVGAGEDVNDVILFDACCHYVVLSSESCVLECNRSRQD